MGDFTPTLDEVRAIYALGTPAHHVSIGGSYAEFDRAIAQIRADAKVEALREAADAFDYGAWDFTRDGMDDDELGANADCVGVPVNWLRTRADNLEAG